MTNETPQSLAIVVPCYNEEEIFSNSLKELTQILDNLIAEQKINKDSYILFVDDGSKDNTWSLIKMASEENQFVRGIKLSHNQGHQMALIAGMSNTDTDMTVTIDADLQDDPVIIKSMVSRCMQGLDIIYGVRASRKADSYLKRFMAQTFYKIMSLLGIEHIYNHADFRLLNRRALDSLLKFQEQNVYLRGLVPMIGFRSEQVYYDRTERIAGKSKYPFKKSLALAIDGITSFSVKPLRMISLVGIMVFVLSVLAIFYTILMKLSGSTIQGWSSMMILMSFFGGLQIMALGIIGEYIGKIYKEVKKRPKYFIEEKCND